MANVCKPLLCFLQRPLPSIRLDITFFFYGFAMKLGLVEFNHQAPPMRFAILRLEGLVGDQGGIAVFLPPSAFSPSKTG